MHRSVLANVSNAFVTCFSHLNVVILAISSFFFNLRPQKTISRTFCCYKLLESFTFLLLRRLVDDYDNNGDNDGKCKILCYCAYGLSQQKLNFYDSLCFHSALFVGDKNTNGFHCVFFLFLLCPSFFF